MIVNSVSKQHKKEIVVLKNFPKVTVAIPVWNEEKSIISTLECILNLDYPLDKLEIIIVDDKSTDNTVGVVKKFISKHKNILLIEHSKNKGKAGAMNTALSKARGDFFWVYDADSYCSKDLLKNLVSRFYEKNNGDVGAVVSITLIKNQGNVVEKMQRLEYVMTAFIRKLTGTVDTLHITNALSLFKTQLIKKLGGFDEKLGINVDDLDLNWRFWIAGYKTRIATKAYTYHWLKTSKTRDAWLKRFWWEFHYSKIQRLFIKNYSVANIIKYLPIYLSVSFIRGVVNIIFRFNFSPLMGLLAGILWNIYQLGDTLKARKKVQSLRVFSDSLLMKKIFVNENLVSVFFNIWLPLWSKLGNKLASETFR